MLTQVVVVFRPLLSRPLLGAANFLSLLRSTAGARSRQPVGYGRSLALALMSILRLQEGAAEDKCSAGAGAFGGHCMCLLREASEFDSLPSDRPYTA